jgi:hypothetical protein
VIVNAEAVKDREAFSEAVAGECSWATGSDVVAGCTEWVVARGG